MTLRVLTIFCGLKYYLPVIQQSSFCLRGSSQYKDGIPIIRV